MMMTLACNFDVQTSFVPNKQSPQTKLVLGLGFDSGVTFVPRKEQHKLKVVMGGFDLTKSNLTKKMPIFMVFNDKLETDLQTK